MNIIYNERLQGWRFILFNIVLGLGHMVVLFGASSYIALLPHVAGDFGGGDRALVPGDRRISSFPWRWLRLLHAGCRVCWVIIACSLRRLLCMPLLPICAPSARP